MGKSRKTLRKQFLSLNSAATVLQNTKKTKKYIKIDPNFSVFSNLQNLSRPKCFLFLLNHKEQYSCVFFSNIRLIRFSTI